MKARVLHVVGALSGGGIQSFLRNLIRYSDQDEYPMDICVMADDAGELAPEFEAMGCRVYHCPLRSAPWSYAARFSALVEANDYRVVHAHRSSAMMAFTLRAARLAGVPVRVAHFQSVNRPSASPRGLLSPVLHRLLLTNATHVIGVSQAVMDTHFPAGWKHDARCVVIPNAVDVESYRRERGRGSYEPIIIGHVARFTEAKNHEAIVEIADHLLKKRPDVRFVLAGDGPDRAKIEGMVRERGLRDRVEFPGWREDVAELLAEFDLFLFPSRWEGFPLALIEAQAAGLACVTSDLPCFGEVLHPDLWALRFPLNQPVEALIGIEFLMNNPDERERLGRLGQDHVKAFDIRHVAARIQAIYEEGLK